MMEWRLDWDGTSKTAALPTGRIHLLRLAGPLAVRGVESSLPTLVFTIEGGFSEDGGPLERRQGDAHLHPAGDEQRAEGRSDVTLLGACLAVTGEESKGLKRLLGERQEWGRGLAPLGWALAQEMARLSPDPLQLESLLWGSFPLKGPSYLPDRLAPWLRTAFDIVEGLDGRGISLSWLADEVGVDRCHLARSYRIAYGVTVGTHARHCRLMKALDLVNSSGLSFTKAGWDAGFTDPSHLRKAWKLFREHGVGPFRNSGTPVRSGVRR